MTELEKSIKKMRLRGAAGPDDIPPSFIKALGPVLLKVLLQLNYTALALMVPTSPKSDESHNHSPLAPISFRLIPRSKPNLLSRQDSGKSHCGPSVLHRRIQQPTQ